MLIKIWVFDLRATHGETHVFAECVRNWDGVLSSFTVTNKSIFLRQKGKPVTNLRKPTENAHLCRPPRCAHKKKHPSTPHASKAQPQCAALGESPGKTPRKLLSHCMQAESSNDATTPLSLCLGGGKAQNPHEPWPTHEGTGLFPPTTCRPPPRQKPPNGLALHRLRVQGKSSPSSVWPPVKLNRRLRAVGTRGYASFCFPAHLGGPALQWKASLSQHPHPGASCTMMAKFVKSVATSAVAGGERKGQAKTATQPNAEWFWGSIRVALPMGPFEISTVL